jgi:pimeloyl-ACP methyl ester carboxylesterase
MLDLITRRIAMKLALSLATLFSPLVPLAGAQLQYDGTTFLNGFASDSLIWESGAYGLQGTTPVNYMGQSILLRAVANPNVSKFFTYSQQTESVAPTIAAGGQLVLVGHSLGSLIARGLYISKPETRPHIAGIVAIAAPHEGTRLADNADEAVRFFADVQRRVNDGIFAIQIEAGVAVVLGYFAPQPLHSIIVDIALYVLNAASGQSISLGDLVSLPKVPALADLKPEAATIQMLTSHFEDASLPRANIYGRIPFEHAAFRIMLSSQGKDNEYAATVDSYNKALTAFKVCKYIGYATIVLGGQGRACAYARIVLKRIDERWVKYVNGSDAFGNPRYVPFDGIVANERSRYPSPNAVAYDIGVNGANHQNIYNTHSGLDQVTEGMRRMGMVQIGGPPVTLTVSISGPDIVNTDWYSTWSAEVSGGTAPYTYSWSGLFYGSGASISGTTSTGGDLILDVYDAVGGHGTFTKTVASTGCAGQNLC